MIKLYDGTLQELLRSGMQYDPEVQALAYATLQEKRRIIDRANQTRTLAMIEELPEDILDLLSVELRTPFYDEGFPIETKRELIKRTFIFYQYMGTPESVNQMLDSAYPGSCIEEWFYYGGEPYHFQVVIETSRARQTASVPDITRAVEKCKRLSAHTDGIIFQCNIGVIIGTHAHGYRYTSTSCGQHQSGTVPWRSTKSGTGHGELEVTPGTDSFRYHADLAGTKPWRSTKSGLAHGELTAGTEAAPFGYTAAAAGTKPWRNTVPALTDGTVDIAATAQGFTSTAKSAGRTEAGTEPWRDTRAGTQEASIGVQATAEGFLFTSPEAGTAQAGTIPRRAVQGGAADGTVEIEAEATGYQYDAPMTGREDAGTVPERDTSGAEEPGAIFAEAEGQGFRYNVKMCGRFYCNNRRREARL